MTTDRTLKQLDRIEETLERMVAEMSAIKTDLNYHIKRSDTLEEKLDLMEQDYHKFRGFFSIAGWLVASAVACLSALKLLQVI